jgi:hypothetical protein
MFFAVSFEILLNFPKYNKKIRPHSKFNVIYTNLCDILNTFKQIPSTFILFDSFCEIPNNVLKRFLYTVRRLQLFTMGMDPDPHSDFRQDPNPQK